MANVYIYVSHLTTQRPRPQPQLLPLHFNLNNSPSPRPRYILHIELARFPRNARRVEEYMTLEHMRVHSSERHAVDIRTRRRDPRLRVTHVSEEAWPEADAREDMCGR
jgi:hypothetical protein